ncbi:hypothetical protein FQA39_LY13538 [Lamprigera yunnana]|nr:hypothetical protein FQA39_LY13538 [Lamprigera yunnana]
MEFLPQPLSDESDIVKTQSSTSSIISESSMKRPVVELLPHIKNYLPKIMLLSQPLLNETENITPQSSSSVVSDTSMKRPDVELLPHLKEYASKIMVLSQSLSDETDNITSQSSTSSVVTVSSKLECVGFGLVNSYLLNVPFLREFVVYLMRLMTSFELKFLFLFLIVSTVYGVDVREFEDDYSSSVNFENVTSTIKSSKCGNEQRYSFGWEDYFVLAAMLIISCGIGIFYGFIGSKQKTSSDFLLGGGSMGTFPMAMSLAASFVTAIELLGNPAEMYNYGSQFWMICVAFILVVPITSKFYLPVFMNLRLTSSYEYLQMRFNRTTNLLACGLYIFQMVLYTSVAVYAPALALSHVTGLNVYLAVTLVYVVCTFYASQGGMKAVIMTDTFQAAVLVVSIVLVLYFGDKLVGGVSVIWPENYNTNRLEILTVNPSPTIRHSFWSVTVGGLFYWMTMFCSNQASIQKYLSVESIVQARKALWVSSIGLIFIYTVNFYTGMVLVAHYRHCDPLRSEKVTASDEILPFYILSELGYMKGITGFFVAGIFAASLGTVASALNSLAAVTCKDFLKGLFGLKITDSREAFWAKCISVAYGIISFGLVFIVEQLGSVMQVALSFNGMIGGITLGLFSLGMFFPWANSKGATTGAILALCLVLWMGIGQQVAVANGSYTLQLKPTSIRYCPCLNKTENVLPQIKSNRRVTFLLVSGFVPMVFGNRFCDDERNSAESGKGVIVAKEYIGGLSTYTFPLLLPGVKTIGFPVNPAIPEGKVPISVKKIDHIQKAHKFVDQNQEAQNFWRDILDWPTVQKDEDP